MKLASREDELRAAAIRLFREKGYHGTSMQDIADALGLYKGSLYHYIRSKEELLARLSEGALDETLGGLERIGADDAAAVDRLYAMVRAYVLAIVRNLDAVAVYLREWRALPATDLARVRGQRRDMRRLFERVIAEGMREGEMRRGDAKIATLAILGMCNWLYEWYRPRGRLSAEELADELAARAVETVR